MIKFEITGNFLTKNPDLNHGFSIHLGDSRGASFATNATKELSSFVPQVFPHSPTMMEDLVFANLITNSKQGIAVRFLNTVLDLVSKDIISVSHNGTILTLKQISDFTA